MKITVHEDDENGVIVSVEGKLEYSLTCYIDSSLGPETFDVLDMDLIEDVEDEVIAHIKKHRMG